ncbi:hypothetical protein M0802_015719 [Mischocyttarus mexicanus]|nr:hypothetical protein M0802_015719 [Mischocyttarus mexicanus]
MDSIRDLLRKEISYLKENLFNSRKEKLVYLLRTKIKKLISDIEKRASCVRNKLQSVINSSVSSVKFEEVIEEVVKRDCRSINLIFSNVDETKASLSLSSSLTTDDDIVKDIIVKIEPSIYPASRFIKIGRESPNRRRPICVKKTSRKDVLCILKNMSLYKSSIFISQDRTNVQRDHLKFLRSKLKILADNGDYSWSIRYFNCIPKLINK